MTRRPSLPRWKEQALSARLDSCCLPRRLEKHAIVEGQLADLSLGTNAGHLIATRFKFATFPARDGRLSRASDLAKHRLRDAKNLFSNVLDRSHERIICENV